MRLVLLRDLHFICIFIDAIKLLTLAFQSDNFDILKWHCEDLSSYQTITLLLQSERLNQPRLSPPSHHCLSHLPNPTLSHHLSSVGLPNL